MPSSTGSSTTLRFLSLTERNLLVLTEFLRLLTWFMLAFQDGDITSLESIICFSLTIAMVKDLELSAYDMSAVSTEFDALEDELDRDKRLDFYIRGFEVSRAEPFSLWRSATRFDEARLVIKRRIYKTDYTQPGLLAHMDEILRLKAELARRGVVLPLSDIPGDFKQLWRYLPHVAMNCDMESKARLGELLLPHLLSFQAGGFWADRLGVPEDWRLRFAVGYSVINWVATAVNSTMKSLRNQRIKAAGFRIYFPAWASINPPRLRTCVGSQMFSRLQFWPDSSAFSELVCWLANSEFSIEQLQDQLGASAPSILSNYRFRSERPVGMQQTQGFGGGQPLYTVRELGEDEEKGLGQGRGHGGEMCGQGAGQAAASGLQKKMS